VSEFEQYYDLLVIGGGINGVGIARDAAGRGLKVALVEKGDLAAATSSASSKLIHGGLRYLEYYEFRLVAEALAEREVLLDIAPHLVTPLAFVMPHVPALRPRWIIRAGLFLYDHLGRRTRLPSARGIDLHATPYGAGLKTELTNGFVYADCRVDDARLVIANAMSARDLGARIYPYAEFLSARRAEGGWNAVVRTGGVEHAFTARAVANAAGPWVNEVLVDRLRVPQRDGIKLIQGSHIVLPRLYAGEHAYILQNDDRRVVFMIPFEADYTLIGTTDVALSALTAEPRASSAEVEYLCRAVNRYLAQPIAADDVVWNYSGIRPLHDDGSAQPSAVTRDYTLRLDAERGRAALLSVFGGKITTYRRLAENALAQLAPWLPPMKAPWTGNTRLPGGAFADFSLLCAELTRAYPALPEPLIRDFARRHGSLAHDVLEGVRSIADLGVPFGASLYAREIDYMIAREWAQTGEDILFRRTKAGLRLSAAQRAAVDEYMWARQASN
jgi:glycerol-3-phosphate dehydrogenase